MTGNKLQALLIAALVAVVAGWYVTRPEPQVAQTAVATGALMFPDLTPKLAAARRIEITAKGKTNVIELKNGVWGLTDRAGYRAKESKLRGMLTALTEMRLKEPRTADPAEFSRLGLEDPLTDKNGPAALLRVMDGAGTELAAVIVGNRRTRAQGSLPEEVYVRRPGENQTWVMPGGPTADTDALLWLDHDLINIPHGLISKIDARRGDQTIELTRDGDVLKVTKPADPPKLDRYKLDDAAHALEALTMDDVRPDTDPLGEPYGEAVFSTVDGLEITVTVSHVDKVTWSRFKVAAPERGKAEAERLNAKLAGWAFQTQGWKDKALVPALDDLKAPPEKEKPEAAKPAPAPPPAPAAAAPTKEEAPRR